MLKLKGNDSQTTLVIDNPNDILDFITSIQNQLNTVLNENNEKNLKQVKLQYGPSRKTSEQLSESYKGPKGYVTLLKKSLWSGDQGYFSGNKNRWKHKLDDKTYVKYFDNHIKINFKLKSSKEREILKTVILILFTFNSSLLKSHICDLDYIEDVETIKDELFETNVYIYARTGLYFRYEYNKEPLKETDYNCGILIEKENEDDDNNKENEELDNGFL